MKKYYYVYRITNIKENKHYYGSRTSIKSPKEDLGVVYFSSSSDKDFINDQKINKENYKYIIVRCFDNRKDSILFEMFLHNKFNVAKNENFYNKSHQTSTGFLYGMLGKKQSYKQKVLTSIRFKNIKKSELSVIRQKETLKNKYKNDYVSLLKGRTLSDLQKNNLSNIMKNKYKNGYISHSKGIKLKVETINKIKSSKSKINNNGYSIYKNSAIKSAETMKKISENGLSIRQNANIKKVNTMKKNINDNGENAYNVAAKKGKITKQITFLENGLNIHQNAAKKWKENLDILLSGETMTTRNKLKLPKKDKKNYAKDSDKINIYDSNDKLVYEINISLKKFCMKNNLPYTAFYKSKKYNTKLYDDVFRQQSITILINKNYYKYKGWYAVLIN